jgi:hypothetical protein
MFFRSSPFARTALVFLSIAGSAYAGPDASSFVTPFSGARPGSTLPSGWSRADIRGVDTGTAYTLVDDQGTTVLRAEANASASAVVYKVIMPARDAPLLQWRWKVSDVLKNSNPATKEGDDYAARVYVMFDYPLEKLPLADRIRLSLARALYDSNVPAATLCYVWDSRLRAGTVLTSPYTSRVRIIVAESGAQHAGQWRTVERDVAEDFRRAFGEEPPAVSAVAVATDTDNTHERVTAWYGDIVLKKRGVTAPRQ